MRRAAPGRAILAAVAAAIGTLFVASAATSALPRGLHPVHALHLRTLASPRGTFTVDVPSGWRFRADSSDQAVYVAPPRSMVPTAFVLGMLPVTGLAGDLVVPPSGNPAAWLRAQLDAMTRRLTAADAIRIFVSALNRGLIPGSGISDVRLLELQSASGSAARAHSRYLVRGVAVEERTFVRTVYFLNPAYSAVFRRNMWDTFLFVSGCTARAGAVTPLMRTCGRILESFRPRSSWLRHELVGYFVNQQRQLGMVQQTLNRIYQMQNQLAAQLRETTFQVGVNWTKVLGADVELIDPNTRTLYTTWDAYRNYCLDPLRSDRVLGTNDQSLLRPPYCGTVLARHP